MGYASSEFDFAERSPSPPLSPLPLTENIDSSTRFEQIEVADLKLKSALAENFNFKSMAEGDAPNINNSDFADLKISSILAEDDDKKSNTLRYTQML
jgi:hypothetical protein